MSEWTSKVVKMYFCHLTFRMYFGTCLSRSTMWYFQNHSLQQSALGHPLLTLNFQCKYLF